MRQVIGPLLSGSETSADLRSDHLQYVRDLGLVAGDDPIRIANPIYREVIPRDLTWTTQAGFTHDPAWYVDAEGNLQLRELLAAFQRSSASTPSTGSSGSSTGRPVPSCCCRHPASRRQIGRPGGARVRTGTDADRLADRLAGRGATDRTRRMVIECKVLHRSLDETIRVGPEQTRAYMDRCAASEGHLVIFDRTEGKPWNDKILCRTETAAGAPITVWGM